ncbi:MAG: glycosyltransferase [Duncaniella sp.]|nr:glycosyltransferase [Duncaniella sp.]
MNSQPLVSVPVITYNSADYIIEGLESIKDQTYQNIELIISDDCSTDNTVEVCRKWLEENKDRFVRTLLVETGKNTGVAGNCNRAIRPCEGEWIKMLSGDDKFLPYTIEGYMEYVSAHPEVNICFAKLHFFGDDNEVVAKTENMYKKLYVEIERLEKQKERYLNHHFIPGTGLFYKKSLWNNVGGFDEKYPFCEEYPFNLYVLEAGESIYFIDRELYQYNVRYGSLSYWGLPAYRNFFDFWKFFKDYRFLRLIKQGQILEAIDQYTVYNKMIAVDYDKSSYIGKIFAKILRLLSPLAYIHKFVRSNG